MEDALCWAYDTTPSHLPRLFWSETYYDIKTKLRVRSSSHQVSYYQDFQIMAEILSAAFGGNKKNDTGVLQPQNKEQAKWMLQKVLSGG